MSACDWVKWAAIVLCCVWFSLQRNVRVRPIGTKFRECGTTPRRSIHTTSIFTVYWDIWYIHTQHRMFGLHSVGMWCTKFNASNLWSASSDDLNVHTVKWFYLQCKNSFLLCKMNCFTQCKMACCQVNVPVVVGVQNRHSCHWGTLPVPLSACCTV